MRDRIDNLQLNNSIGQQAKAPACASFGRRAAGHCDQPRLLLSVEPATAVLSRATPIQGRVQSCQHEALTHALNGSSADVQVLADVFGFQDPRMRKFSGLPDPLVDHAA